MRLNNGFTIDRNNPTFIIAECGINHEGSLDIAKRLAFVAKESGADCAKFQKRSIKDLYGQNVINNMDHQEQGVQYIYNYVKKFELSDDDFVDLKRYCDDIGIMMACTPFDRKSLELVVDLNLPFVKVGSPTLQDVFLLRDIIDTGMPIIASIGMMTMSEIFDHIRILEARAESRFALLHCVSSYPSEFSELNLGFMKQLIDTMPYPIGYSGHERGISISLAAVAMGACIVERHITLDRCSDNPDNRVSLEPDGFRRLVRDIRNLELAIGSSVKYLTRSEYQSREALSKSLVASRSIPMGKVIEWGDLGAKCPGNGLSTILAYKAVGVKSPRNIETDEQISYHDIKGEMPASSVKLKPGYGIVGRFSDVDKMMWMKPDWVEFHLTDSDLSSHVQYKKYDCNFSFHMPEYLGNVLMDISSPDEKIREASIDIVNRTADIALMAMNCSRGNKPRVVVHPGGGFINKVNEYDNIKKNLIESIKELTSRSDVDFFFENMPPFPIYFGGVWYQYIFMSTEEIIDICKETGIKICYDISHAGLYCNNSNHISQYQHMKQLCPFIGHLHIADYAGVGGEGLQIYDGEAEWADLKNLIDGLDVPKILEIWRGHKFDGYGFAQAMELLNGVL